MPHAEQQLSTIRPDESGKPRSKLPGQYEIHFIPSARSPVTQAGIACRKLCGRPGMDTDLHRHVRFTAAIHAIGFFDNLDDLPR